MKRNYLKLKIKLTALVIVILLIGCGALTYQHADQIRTDYKADAYAESGFCVDVRFYNLEGGENLIQQVYYQYANVWCDTNMGFYSMLKNVKTGETLAEEQNCILVIKEGEDQTENDMRVLLLDNGFGGDGGNFEKIDDHTYEIIEVGSGQWRLMNYFVSEIEIVGTCDDTYIYLEELKWKDMQGLESFSYIPDEIQNAESQETVSFEEWAGGRYWGDDIESQFALQMSSVYDTYGDELYRAKLNAEAKEICEQIYADYANETDTMNDQSEDGLFTCYVAGTGYISDEYALPYVFVFHPVSIAMDELTGVYVIAGLIGLVIILFIIAVINKLYNQQLAYENNRRGLTRGIAHELKTPLAVTKGYIENWEYLDEDERHESAKTMIAEIDHMDKMVTDLLELSRLEAKAKQMNIEEVDIYALTKSVLGRMKSVIDERQLNVQMTPDVAADEATEDVSDKTAEDMSDKTAKDVADNAYIVMADLEMMRVVLTNFISNAVKYAKNNIEISLSVHKGRVKFVISNDGKTISTDKVDRVWDEFYKDESSNNSRIGSSGLGLAITKNILILHNAKYGCESNIGQITFWFEMKTQR